VNASELAQLGVCERRLLFEHEFGPRHSDARDAALRRGSSAHDMFYADALSQQGGRRQTAAGPCFIASAVYGESRETVTLRHFRDEVLLRHAIGRWLVHVYYQVAPAIASFLARSERRRALARACLKPLVSLAAMVTERGRRVQ